MKCCSPSFNFHFPPPASAALRKKKYFSSKWSCIQWWYKRVIFSVEPSKWHSSHFSFLRKCFLSLCRSCFALRHFLRHSNCTNQEHNCSTSWHTPKQYNVHTKARPIAAKVDERSALGKLGKSRRLFLLSAYTEMSFLCLTIMREERKWNESAVGGILDAANIA